MACKYEWWSSSFKLLNTWIKSLSTTTWSTVTNNLLFMLYELLSTWLFISKFFSLWNLKASNSIKIICCKVIYMSGIKTLQLDLSAYLWHLLQYTHANLGIFSLLHSPLDNDTNSPKVFYFFYSFKVKMWEPLLLGCTCCFWMIIIVWMIITHHCYIVTSIFYLHLLWTCSHCYWFAWVENEEKIFDMTQYPINHSHLRTYDANNFTHLKSGHTYLVALHSYKMPLSLSNCQANLSTINELFWVLTN